MGGRGAGVPAMIGAVARAFAPAADRPSEPNAAPSVVLVVSLLGSGLASWRARPEKRLGLVMALTGTGFFASS